MRRRRSQPGLPEAWRALAGERVRQWPLLDDAERARLEEVAALLLRKRWEASHGFAIDDTMRMTVALNAALLSLGHPGELFSNVSAVVIHPTTMVLRGERPGPSPGVVTNAPLRALGHTSSRGPVFIAWDSVERELRASRRTTNVVLHEFAHKVDALNGTLDGTPPLADADQLHEWVEVCSAELAVLRRGRGTGVLDPYAATNPSEFFAVATEVFFEQPVLLRQRHPQLYGVLSRFYRQDAAGREEARPGSAWSTGTVSATTRAITSSPTTTADQ